MKENDSLVKMLSAHGINAKQCVVFESDDDSHEKSVTSLDSLLDLLQSDI